MENWQRLLELSPEWKKLVDDEITIQEFAGIVATKLDNLEPFPESEEVDEIKEELIEKFELLENDLDASQADLAADLDYCMDELYDWGDISLGQNKKVCWINVLG